MTIWSSITYPSRVSWRINVPTPADAGGTGLRQRDNALIHQRDNAQLQVR